MGAGLTTGAGDGVVGGVEGLHEGEFQVALRDEIDGPASVLGGVLRGLPLGRRIERIDENFVDGGHDAGATLFGVEETGDMEHTVADFFGFEAGTGEAGEEATVGVFGDDGLGCDGGLAPGVGRQDEAVHVLDAVAGGDEFVGEIVEEFGIERAFAHTTEVVGGADDAASEMVVPDAVDHDTSG